MDVYSERTMGYLSLHVNCNIHNGIYVVFSVLVDIDCNKCGQTSHPVVRAQIQTSCNTEKSICSCNYFLGRLYCRFRIVFLELSHNAMA